MENASKALIIAGAILLSILIISLGIIIYRQAAGVVDGNQMEELEMQTFNAKFTQYTGTKVKATVVRNMFDLVTASNVNASEKITVYKKESTGETAMTAADVEDGKTYKVTVTDSNSNGYVDKIVVE